MTMPTPTRDDWKTIPDAVLATDQRQQDAASWANQARADLASQWADSARTELFQNYPMSSDALTNPLGMQGQSAGSMAVTPSPSPEVSSSPVPSQPPAPALPAPSAPAPLDLSTGAQPPSPSAPPPMDLSSRTQPTGSITPANVGGRQGFADSFQPYAEYAGRILGVDPSIVTAMAISESGGGNIPGNSFFGMKGSPFASGSINLPTWELVNGQRVNINDNFATFSSPKDAVDAWIDFLSKHTPGVFGAKTPEEFAAGLKAGGYMTDTAAHYAQTLRGLGAQPGGGSPSGELPTLSAGQQQAPSAQPDTAAAPKPQQTFDFFKTVQQARDALGQTTGGATDAVTGALQQAPKTFNDLVSEARQAVGSIGQDLTAPQPMTASMQPTPSDTLTNPIRQQNPTTPPLITSNPPSADQTLGTAAQNAGQAVSDFGMGRSPISPSNIMQGAENAAGNAIRTVQNFVGPGPFEAGQTMQELGQKYPTTLTRRSDGSTYQVPIATDTSQMTPEDQQRLANAIIAVGGVTAPSYNPKTAASPELQKLGQMFEPDTAKPNIPILTQAARVRDTVLANLTRAFTDRNVDLNRVQESYARAVGRPLNADEMASELSRLAASPAAEVKIDEGLKPAIQAVGKDYSALRDYVTLRNNVQVADALGQKAVASGIDRPVPSALRDRLNAVNTSLRMRQDVVSRLQDASVPDEAAVSAAQRRVAAAERSAQRAQNAIDTWQQANAQQASTEGAQVAQDRMFSGGLNREQSLKAIQDLQAELGPQRFQTVQAAADQVSQFSNSLRQRLVDSGVLSEQQAAEMQAKYPDWVKTRILDYMDNPQGGQGAGTKIGLSNRDVRAYTVEGTSKAREDPLASTVAYAHQVERMAVKNEAFNAFLKLDQQSPAPQLRKVAQDFSPTRNQTTITGFVDGEKVKYVTDNKALGNAINGAGVVALPEWTTAWQRFVRATATSRNPVFLAGNAALDIPEYVIRSTIREGGPQSIPHVLWELAKGYGTAFQGLAQGEFKGATAEFLKAGGGQAGYFTGGEGLTRQSIREFQRPNVWTVNNAGDLGRIVKDLVTLKPVEALGERIELGPRTAAYNLAKQRGANTVQAVIDGRTVTIDFAQGGTVTKFLNQFIPFFNVGFQGPAQVARGFRDNPGAFVATTGSLIGLPTIAAEAWNRADPQRAKDYADVPQYLKDQGVVVMLPGDAAVDSQGNRKPAYIWLNARNWAPFVVAAREAAARVLGDNSRSWQDVVGSAAKGTAPISASNLGDLAQRFSLAVPGVGAAGQLAINKDLFRNRDIVTQRNDQQASATAKALTPAVQAVASQVSPQAEVRPSAVDFAIRDQLAGVGNAVLGAGDLALGAQRQDNSPQSLPVAGGLLSRFVRNQTGEQLQQARSETVTPEVRQMLRQNGITTTPGPVSDKVNGIPLKMTEEAQYQRLANQYINEGLTRLMSSSTFSSKTDQGKQSLVDGVIQGARDKAGLEVLKTIPADEKRRRLKTGSTAP